MTGRGSSSAAAIPVVLPHVVVQAHDDDAVTITTDGCDMAGTVVRRADLGAALAAIADQAGGPIRVEIHEPDGTRHVDILTPPPPATADVPMRPAQKRRRRRRDIEIAGDGFLPGETVLVATTVRTETADHTGHVTVRLDRRTPATKAAAGTLVFGTVSSTLLLAEPS